MFIPIALLLIFTAEVERAKVPHWESQLKAQIQVESAWRPNARSAYAAGLAQFTPPTWGDVAPYTKPSCAGVPETDPACSIRAQIRYMKQLLDRYQMRALSEYEQWAFAWVAYNHGMGWVDKEIRRCKRSPNCTASIWFDHVERKCLTALWACEESRNYPKKIIKAMNANSRLQKKTSGRKEIPKQKKEVRKVQALL